MKTTRFFLERTNFGRYVDVHLVIEDHFGKLNQAQPCTFKTIEDGEQTVGSPLIRLQPEQAQLLIDELWVVGFRPTQGRQSEGQVASTEKHLADMRAITFAQLRIQQP
jgi:hypothetical protein